MNFCLRARVIPDRRRGGACPRLFYRNIEFDLEDGIDEVVAPGVEREEVGRYDLSGREVDGSHKGITIVRYDDGSATKIYQD